MTLHSFQKKIETHVCEIFLGLGNNKIDKCYIAKARSLLKYKKIGSNFSWLSWLLFGYLN